MRTIKMFCLAGLTALLLVVGLAPMASAAEATTPATIVAKSSSSSTDEGKVTSSSAVTVTAEGVPVVAHVVPGGTPRAQQKRCFRIKKAGVYYTSFKSSSGATLWKWKQYPAGYRFCKAGKKVIDPNCHNTVRIKGPKAPGKHRPDAFVEVVSFSWQVTATATTTATAKAQAEAKCEANGVSASASASGAGFASGSASSTASGSTQAAAATAARAAARAKAAALKATLEASALAEASAKASAAAAAEAHCTGVPTQPVDRKPVVNIMGSPAHLYVGGNAYVWIEASDPDGDPVSVKVSASGGGTVSGLVPVTVRWDGTACPSGTTCYRAQVWAGQTPGQMTVTATVSANGLNGEPDSATWPIVRDEF